MSDGSSTQFGGLFSGNDADTVLANALRRSLVQLNQRAFRELVFLRFYLGAEEADPLLDYILDMKYHQTPAAVRRLTKVIEARSLYDMLSSQFKNINLGGK